MKSLTTLALSTGLMFTPLVISTVSASSAVYADAHSDELREAAGALAYRAGLARDVLLDLARESPGTDIAKASRLALAIRSMALDLEEQLDSRDDSVQQTLDEIEAKVLAFEAAKRSILQRYPANSQLRIQLNNVRRSFYYLKQLLTEGA